MLTSEDLAQIEKIMKSKEDNDGCATLVGGVVILFAIFCIDAFLTIMF